MSERKEKEVWLQKVGQLIREKRYLLGREFQNREFLYKIVAKIYFNITSGYLYDILTA